MKADFEAVVPDIRFRARELELDFTRDVGPAGSEVPDLERGCFQVGTRRVVGTRRRWGQVDQDGRTREWDLRSAILRVARRCCVHAS